MRKDWEIVVRPARSRDQRAEAVLRRKPPKPDRYGLMPGEREMLEEDQGHMCAICGRFPSTRRLAVDHHHACSKRNPRGSVRGLLCYRCNRGFLGENPTLLRRAADYFEAHVCPVPPRRKP